MPDIQSLGRVSILNKGTFDFDTEYIRLDLVEYEGSSFLAKQNTIGHYPIGDETDEYWTLIAHKGDTGETGKAVVNIQWTSTTGGSGAPGEAGATDTYTINYSDETTSTFVVTNGINGTGAGTVTSVGITNGGGLTITNSPITTSGNITVGHTNTTEASSQMGLEYIQIDAYGHITQHQSKDIEGIGGIRAPLNPSNGQVLVYDQGQWIAGSGLPSGGSAGNLLVKTQNDSTWSSSSVINTQLLVNNAVVTDKIDDGAVTDLKLASGAVTSSKIANGAVTSDAILPGAITSAAFSNGAITSAAFANNAIVSAAISAGAITAGKIAANAVTSSVIASGAVTQSAIANGAITANAIGSGAVTGVKILDGAVGAAKIAANAVSTVYTTALDTAWAGDSVPYTKDQSVSGILATDYPIIDLVPDDDDTIAQGQEDEWANIYKAIAGAGQITFYAHNKPTVSLPIKIRCIRR